MRAFFGVFKADCPGLFLGPARVCVFRRIWRSIFFRQEKDGCRPSDDECDYKNFFHSSGARGEIRTPKPLRALPPQGSASTSFATRAFVCNQYYNRKRASL